MGLVSTVQDCNGEYRRMASGDPVQDFGGTASLESNGRVRMEGFDSQCLVAVSTRRVQDHLRGSKQDVPDLLIARQDRYVDPRILRFFQIQGHGMKGGHG